jgi:hypothetical protein
VNRWGIALLGSALALSAGIPGLSSALSAGQDPIAPLSLDDQQGQLPTSAPSESEAEDNDADDADKGDDAGRHGPPSWAHGGKAKAHDKSLTTWKRLTPAQREATMAKLVHEHTTGMKKFSACVAAGRQDCVKPLPPGLAKRG